MASNFYGSTFIYDGIPSETYGLYLIGLSNADEEASGESYAISSTEKAIGWKCPFFGFDSCSPLSFELVIGSDKPLSALERSRIKRWLIGRGGYKKLQIVHPEMLSVYYRCIFTEEKTFYVGGAAYAFKCTAVCDSPYQYGDDLVASKSISGSGTWVVRNDSDIDGYTLPCLKITMGSSGGTISVTNTDDENRVCELTGLSGGEVILMDCRNKILTSSSGVGRLDSFNKKWLRLVHGENHLTVSGSATLVLTVPVIRRVGA